MEDHTALEALKIELKPLTVHVVVLLLAEAIVYILAKATGWLFSFSIRTQITIAVVMTLIVLSLFIGFITARSRRQQQEITKLKSRVDNAEKTNLINPQLNEYVHELEADGRRHPYPYSYSLVSQKATVDAFGGYTATYMHEATNDSDRVINNYEFHLRTSERVHFDDMNLQAWVSIDNRPLATAVFEGEKWNSRGHRIVVYFQTPVAKQCQFKVQLRFSFPNALRTGQDGDAIDLGRFKSVSRATMELSFAHPVEQPGWYWLNKDAKENTLQLYPWPPPIGDERRNFVFDLHQSKIERTVYSFICHFKAASLRQATNNAVASNSLLTGALVERTDQNPLDLGSASKRAES